MIHSLNPNKCPTFFQLPPMVSSPSLHKNKLEIIYLHDVAIKVCSSTTYFFPREATEPLKLLETSLKHSTKFKNIFAAAVFGGDDDDDDQLN